MPSSRCGLVLLLFWYSLLKSRQAGCPRRVSLYLYFRTAFAESWVTETNICFAVDLCVDYLNSVAPRRVSLASRVYTPLERLRYIVQALDCYTTIGKTNGVPSAHRKRSDRIQDAMDLVDS